MRSDSSTTETVASTDGVAVVVHHLASGPPAAPVLIAHATGFHGRAYAPMAVSLGDGHDVWALDFRGHGATAAPAGWHVDWNGYGDDALCAATSIVGHRAVRPGSLVGFGHSMGGATLLMAALRDPELFRMLVLYEPIVFPPPDESDDPETSPLVRGARRRRGEFSSYEEALANYSSKPPLNAFHPAALKEYVDGGFRPIDPGLPDGRVQLRCSPEHEAETFASSHCADLWDALGDITTPTVVIGGRLDDASPPASLAEPIAERLPNGGYHAVPELDHFGPFVEPRQVADLILSMID